MICASTTSQTGQPIFGIVYPTVWSCLTGTVNTLTNKLDKFWQHQPIIFNFKAEIQGTESRSWYQILVFVLVNVVYNI